VSALPYHPDILIEYLTELGSGSWSRFRDAVAACRVAVGHPPIWAARSLAALAHLELDPDSLDWAICPPAILELPADDRPTGIVSGARSPRFFARLIEAVEALGGEADLSPSWEDSIVLRMRFWLRRRDDFPKLAERLGVRFLPTSARKLAEVLPSIDALVAACPQEMPPPASTLERYDAGFEWRPAGRSSGPGLYRLRSIPYDRFWVVTEDASWRVPFPTGLFASRRDLLRYDPAARRVSFHARARPPDLHLRTLALCSGRLPERATAYRLALEDVPPSIFDLVARSLRQQGVA
jgi:hypothetical protein